MMLFVVAVIAGFALLIWSAGRCVTGAAATARHFGVPPLIIGLTVVGFGSSAPEFLVSGMAAWSGNTGLAIGNVIGSNITNIGLVLGIAALLAPLTVQSETLRREFPLLLAVTLLAYWLMADGVLSRLDGVILIAALIGVIYLLFTSSGGNNLKAVEPAVMTRREALSWLLSGLVVMLAASRLLVWGSVNIAHLFGVSDLVIGLSLVAIGASLPELMTSVMGALKREHEIALGNIIGSNIFNLLGVLGVTGLIHPDEFELEVLTRDFPWMIGLTLIMFMMAYGLRGQHQQRIGRASGAILLLAFCGYMVWLYKTSSN